MAAIHRDDSDDEDEDDDIDDSFEGWEDALAESRYPDEGNSESTEVEYGPLDEYWDEDDEDEFEEERETYWGFASVSAVGGLTLPEMPPTMATSISFGSGSNRGENEAGPSNAIRTESAASSYGSSTADPSASRSCPHNCNSKSSLSPPMISDMERPASAPVSGQRPAVRYGCPLCLETPGETSATRCGHIFCTPLVTLLSHRASVADVSFHNQMHQNGPREEANVSCLS